MATLEKTQQPHDENETREDETDSGLPPKVARLKLSFIVVASTILFLLIAVPMNINLRGRYKDLILEVVKLESSRGESPPPMLGELQKMQDQRIKNVYVQAGLSIVLLLAALFVILSKRYTPTDKHWAYGIVGTMVGFWFGGGP